MLVITETQLAVSKEDSTKLLNYAVGEIHMYDLKTEIKVFIRTKLNFDTIAGVLKKFK